MALCINSCLKPSSKPFSVPPNPSSTLSKTTLTPGWTSKETSWQSRCVSTAACVILGSTVGFAGGDGGLVVGDLWAVAQPEAKAVQWSDKRKCPPWDANYLERSMPEKLPRSYTRGKTDGFVHHRHAPAAAPLIRYNRECFSL